MYSLIKAVRGRPGGRNTPSQRTFGIAESVEPVGFMLS